MTTFKIKYKIKNEIYIYILLSQFKVKMERDKRASSQSILLNTKKTLDLTRNSLRNLNTREYDTNST